MTSHNPSRWWNAVPGIGFVVLVSAGFALLMEERAYDADPARKAAYYEDGTYRILVGANLTGLGAILLLWFCVVLYRRITSDQAGPITGAIVPAGAVVSALWLASSATQVAAVSSEPPLDPGASAALFDLRQGLVDMAALGLGSLRTGVLPRWVGWGGLVIAAPLLLLPDRTIPFMGAMSWCIATSLALIGTRTPSTDLTGRPTSTEELNIS